VIAGVTLLVTLLVVIPVSIVQMLTGVASVPGMPKIFHADTNTPAPPTKASNDQSSGNPATDAPPKVGTDSQPSPGGNSARVAPTPSKHRDSPAPRPNQPQVGTTLPFMQEPVQPRSYGQNGATVSGGPIPRASNQDAMSTHPVVAANANPRAAPTAIQMVGDCGGSSLSQEILRRSLSTRMRSVQGNEPVVIKINGGTRDEVSQGLGTGVTMHGSYTICVGRQTQDCPDPSPSCQSSCRINTGSSLSESRDLAADRIADMMARRLDYTSSSSEHLSEGLLCDSN
jgi:hypothetical protein